MALRLVSVSALAADAAADAAVEERAAADTETVRGNVVFQALTQGFLGRRCTLVWFPGKRRPEECL
jgi:hypothetical protein